MSAYDLKDKMIVLHNAGSISYGTNLPTSDVDVRGIFCASPEEIRTPFFPVREVTLPDHEDGKVYELSNFLQLYTQGNPNILESLWVDSDDVLEHHPAYNVLKEFRHDLLSSKVAHTFSGYAISQLKRIRGHNKWINNPQPEQKPVPVHFVSMIQNYTAGKIFKREFSTSQLMDAKLIPYGNEIYGVVPDYGSNAFNSEGQLKLTPYNEIEDNYKNCLPMYIVKFNKEEYVRAVENHNNYWKWKNNRNEKRGKLEEQFGYDTKHAMHLVRLLRMGEEVLSGKGVIVKRPDAKELLDIRAGKWDYEDLVAYAEEKDAYIRGELYKNTSLPKTPDLKLASEVLMECQNLFWRK